MDNFDYDFFVIGAGSGGVRAARVAAALGARVAVAEDRYLGGTCVNVGCVPKKLFVYGSHYQQLFAEAAGYGWHAEQISFQWPELKNNKNREIARLNGIYGKLLESAGVTLFNGRAQFLDSHRLQIGEQKISAARTLIATGSWPYVPDMPGAQHAITSNEAFYLDALPERIAIVGGGYIAVEFAGIFNGLGVETHLLYRGPLFLRGFDADVREHLKAELTKQGVHLHFNTNVKSIEVKDGLKQLKIDNNQTLEVGEVMYATGRKPLTEGLGLANTGVKLGAGGEILVDRHYGTNDPAIFAVGDVSGGKELTPIAIAEGSALANNLFGTAAIVDYHNIPTAVFSQPSIGTVGYTEAEARLARGAIRVYETRFREMKHTLGGADEMTYMKLIVADADDKVIGAHIVGDAAGEIIQSVAVAMKAGATKRDFDETMAIHPTAAEELVTMSEPARVLGN